VHRGRERREVSRPGNLALQPATDDFEVFAEGGGNTYSLEFDAKGRAFSGTNYGETRGMYYSQGSAGVKNWGKHGPLMNPYSFGWFEHMAHKGYGPRFAQTICIYEGGAIPQLEGLFVAPMSLMNRVMASRLSRDTSTYRTDDLDPPLVLTDDRWFRPVDTKVGPDGAIYWPIGMTAASRTSIRATRGTARMAASIGSKRKARSRRSHSISRSSRMTS
jgi:hypothetical protein